MKTDLSTLETHPVSQQLAPPKTPTLIWSIIAILASFILILIRILPIGGPVVFSDEYTYAAWTFALYHGVQGPSSLTPALSNWLYLRLYEIVYIGSGSFLSNARVLNALISAASAGMLVPIFYSCGWCIKPVLATLLAIGFSVALQGTYAAYFMPDAPYYASVCLLLFCVWKHACSPRVATAVALGLAGGIATMTKTHGLFLLPAILLVLPLMGRKKMIIVATVAATWFACTAAITTIFGHGVNFNPLGEFYTHVGAQAAVNAEAAEKLLILRVAAHHLAALALIAGLPLIVCFWLALQTIRSRANANQRPLEYLALFLSCALVGMVLVTAIFTVGVAGESITESINRLHGRYYEHIALLAAIVGIVESEQVLTRWSWKTRSAVGVAFIFLLVLSLWLLDGVGWQNPNDFALAYALFAAPEGRHYLIFIAVASGAAALAWPKHARIAMASGLFLWLGLNVIKTDQLRWHIPEIPSGRLATMIAGVEAGDDRAKIEIVAPSATVPMYRAAFELIKEDVKVSLGPNPAKCSVDGASPKWVITFGASRNPCTPTEVFRIGDTAAYRTE